jgi:hypothetical protein
MKRAARPQHPSSDAEEPLQVTIPRVTKRSLKMRAAESGEPMRVIVLKALASAGITVPQSELHDRRKET